MIVQNDSIIDSLIEWIAKPKPPPIVRVAPRLDPNWTPARFVKPDPPSLSIDVKPKKPAPAKAPRIYTRDEALTDVLTNRKKPIPSQKVLAQRWGVTKGAVSKWLARWENEGLVKRAANGRFKTVRAA